MPRSRRFLRAAVFLIVSLGVQTAHASASIKRVVVLGDSIAEGLGVAHEDAFPEVLQKLLIEKGYSQVTVINAGVSGSTTSSGVSRLRWQLNSHPDILILELGANDMLRGQPASLAKKNLADVIRMAQDAHMKVLLAGMKVPPNYGETYDHNFEKIYPELAAEFHTALIPFLLDGVAGDPALNQGDGVHPNVEGHRKVAQLVFRYLEPLL